MVKSTVVDNQSGKSVSSNIRTSSGTFLTRQQDATISKIESKIAEASQVPEGEPNWCYQLFAQRTRLLGLGSYARY